MYKKLLENLIFCHNDEIAYENLLVSILPMQIDISNKQRYDCYNIKKALVINIGGDIVVFETLSITYRKSLLIEHFMNFKNWIEIKCSDSYDVNGEIRNLNDTASFSNCAYCGYQNCLFYINTYVPLCKTCLNDLRIYHTGNLNFQFPFAFDKTSRFRNGWYNIDDRSLNLWYKNDNSYQRVLFTVSNKLLSMKIKSCYLSPFSSDTRCSICGGFYGPHTNKCLCCYNILIWRDIMIIQFLPEKLISILTFDICDDIKLQIVKLLISLICK